MEPEKVAKRLLRKIPWFMKRSPVSATRAHIKTVGGELQAAETTTNLIKTIFAPRRPIRLWREQTRPKEYIINFDVALRDLKRIILYEDDRKIFDTRELKYGTHHYQRQLALTSATIIPRRRYSLEVEDHWGNLYEKGIPENLQRQGNAFDADFLLDLKGKLVGCPRYRFKEVPPSQLRLTYPKFHDQLLEPDYYFEKRIARYLELLNTKGVIHASMYRYIGAEPIIEGYWRYLCEQDVSLQDQNDMSTKWMNSAVFYVMADPHDIPRNLQRDAKELEKISQAISPSKRFIYRVLFKKGIEALEEVLKIAEKWTFVAPVSLEDSASIEDRQIGALSHAAVEQTKVSDLPCFRGRMGVVEALKVADLFDLLAIKQAVDKLGVQETFGGQTALEYSDAFRVADFAEFVGHIQPAVDGTTVREGPLSGGFAGALPDLFKSKDAVAIDAETTFADSLKSGDAASLSLGRIVGDLIRSKDAVTGDTGGTLTDLSKVKDAITFIRGIFRDSFKAKDAAALDLRRILSDLFRAKDVATSDIKGVLSDLLKSRDAATFEKVEGKAADPIKARDAAAGDTAGARADRLAASDKTPAVAKAAPADAFRPSDATQGGLVGRPTSTVNVEESGWIEQRDVWLVYETDSDFRSMTLTGDVIIEGTGKDAVLTVKESEGQSQADEWRHPEDADIKTYRDCLTKGVWYYIVDTTGPCDDESGRVYFSENEPPCHTDILILKNFDFPETLADKKIVGIEAFIRLRQHSLGLRRDHLVRLRIGDRVSENKADKENNYPTTPTKKFYGGERDLWGFDKVSGQDLKNLQLEYAADNLKQEFAVVYVYCAGIRVHYLTGGEPGSGTASYTLTFEDFPADNVGYMEIYCEIPDGEAHLTITEIRSNFVRRSPLKDGINLFNFSNLQVEPDDEWVFEYSLEGGESGEPRIHWIKHFESAKTIAWW